MPDWFFTAAAVIARRLATDNLRKMGYTNILSLDGGWRALEISGLPLEYSQ